MFETTRVARVLGIALLAIALATLTTPLFGQPAVTAWPMMGQNAQRTGESDSLVPGSLLGDLKWVAGTSETKGIAIGKEAIYTSTNANGLVAIGFDGSLKWRLPMSIDNLSPAVAADETIYVGRGNGYGFYAINAALPGAFVDAQLQLQNGVKWSYAGLYDTQQSPAIDQDGSVVILSRENVSGSSQSFIYKFSPGGALQWKLAVRGTTGGSAAIDTDGTIYAPGGILYAVTSDGTLKWTYTASVAVDGVAIGADHTVYCASSDWILHALDPAAPAKSRLKWKATVGPKVSGHGMGVKANYGDPRLAIDNAARVIYCGGGDGLYAVTTTGVRKWKYATSKPIRGHPAIGGDGTVYAYSGDSSSDESWIYAIASDGTLRWRARVGFYYTLDPVIGDDGTVYIGGRPGLHAFQDDAPGEPTIFYAKASVNPIPAGQAAKLWAMEVTEGIFPIEQIDFYLDDGDGDFDPTLDQLLGTSTAPYSTGGTSWCIDLAAGALQPTGGLLFGQWRWELRPRRRPTPGHEHRAVPEQHQLAHRPSSRRAAAGHAHGVRRSDRIGAGHDQ